MQQYDSVKQLRYGHLMIMTDQDHDGSHIKGLIMNFFHHFYPSLLKLPGFLLEFITPIVKVGLLLCLRQAFPWICTQYRCFVIQLGVLKCTYAAIRHKCNYTIDIHGDLQIGQNASRFC